MSFNDKSLNVLASLGAFISISGTLLLAVFAGLWWMFSPPALITFGTLALVSVWTMAFNNLPVHGLKRTIRQPIFLFNGLVALLASIGYLYGFFRYC